MAAYGASIDEFLTAIRVFIHENEELTPDPTIEVAYHLSLAYGEISRLKELGVDTTVSGRELVIPSLLMAWRELLFLRQSRLPASLMEGDIPRPVSLTRAGRILFHKDGQRVHYQKVPTKRSRPPLRPVKRHGSTQT